jgi:hypothetical protein
MVLLSLSLNLNLFVNLLLLNPTQNLYFLPLGSKSTQYCLRLETLESWVLLRYHCGRPYVKELTSHQCYTLACCRLRSIQQDMNVEDLWAGYNACCKLAPFQAVLGPVSSCLIHSAGLVGLNRLYCLLPSQSNPNGVRGPHSVHHPVKQRRASYWDEA